jgi:SAM-dependent methyltransferase
MGMEVLQDRSQIRVSRNELKRLGLSQIPHPLQRLRARLTGARRLTIGDEIKSWDVLRTLEFIRQHVAQDEAILDIGCYASETLVALYEWGYRNLTGADLNPDIHNMPHAQHIRYEVTDFMQTPFADASFAAITSISVIEHGFDRDRLLKEMARLLKPGGHFIASFDYWPEKIDTTGIKFFDAEWTIFSRSEVEDFLRAAATHSLHLTGSMNTGAADRVVRAGGKQYTFAWMVLRKSN